MLQGPGPGHWLSRSRANRTGAMASRLRLPPHLARPALVRLIVVGVVP